MSTADRAKRLTRIATALGHVTDADLLLVAEVCEDLALRSAQVVNVPRYPTDPLERGREEREIRLAPATVKDVMKEVTGG